jgi:hypothetical protein
VLAGVVAVLTLLLVIAGSQQADSAHRTAARQRSWLGHQAVVVGTYADLQSCGIPLCAGARYTVTVPADAPVPEAGTQTLVDGYSSFFFLPGTEVPQQEDILLGYRDGRLQTLKDGPIGSLHPLTAADVEASDRAATIWNWATIAIGVLGGTGTLLLTIRAVRRRRASLQATSS